MSFYKNKTYVLQPPPPKAAWPNRQCSGLQRLCFMFFGQTIVTRSIFRIKINWKYFLLINFQRDYYIQLFQKTKYLKENLKKNLCAVEVFDGKYYICCMICLTSHLIMDLILGGGVGSPVLSIFPDRKSTNDTYYFFFLE